MTAYEYKRLVNPSEAELNVLGVERWRVVSVLSEPVMVWVGEWVQGEHETKHVVRDYQTIVYMERVISAGAQPL